MSRWSYKELRRILEIVASSKSVDEIVTRTGRAPDYIRKLAAREGVTLPKPKGAAPRMKAKAK